MKKILIISKFFYPDKGGIETMVQDFIDFYQDSNKKDIEFEILCFHRGRSNIVEYKGIKVRKVKILGQIFSMPIPTLGYFFISPNQYDAIYIHLPNPIGILMLFLKNVNAKIIIHWHSDILNKGILHSIVKPMEKWILRKSDCTIFTSKEYYENSYSKKYISNPSIIPLSSGITKKVLDIPIYKKGSKKIIFALGRLVPYKGFENLVKAFEYLDKSYFLHIGGEGPEKKKLKTLIKNLSLNSNVKLLGKISDEELKKEYQEAEVFCLPSIDKREAFGIVQIEAMYYGCALLSTHPVGSGMKSINENYITGLVLEKNYPEYISEKIKEIFQEEKILKTYQENSTLKQKEVFSYYKINEQIENTILQYLS